MTPDAPGRPPSATQSDEQPHTAHTRGYAGLGPDEGQDKGAYCIECSDAVQDYVWPCTAVDR